MTKTRITRHTYSKLVYSPMNINNKRVDQQTDFKREIFNAYYGGIDETAYPHFFIL